MTNANVLPRNNRKSLALLWGVACLIMLGALLTLLPQSRLNSSVLAMLPKQALGNIPPGLNDGFMQRLDQQLVWLVSPGKQADPQVARDWLALLQNPTRWRTSKARWTPTASRHGAPFSGSIATA